MNNSQHDSRICFHKKPPNRDIFSHKKTFALTSIAIIESDCRELNFKSIAPVMKHTPSNQDHLGYWSFLFGNAAISMAMQLAGDLCSYMKADECTQDNIWYSTTYYSMPHFSDFQDLPKTLDRASELECIIIDRLDEGSRQTLLSQARHLLKKAAADQSITTSDAWTWTQDGIGLQALLSRWPALVWGLLDARPDVYMFIYRAAILMGLDSHELNIATVRADPSRIIQVNVPNNIDCQFDLT